MSIENKNPTELNNDQNLGMLITTLDPGLGAIIGAMITTIGGPSSYVYSDGWRAYKQNNLSEMSTVAEITSEMVEKLSTTLPNLSSNQKEILIVISNVLGEMAEQLEENALGFDITKK